VRLFLETQLSLAKLKRPPSLCTVCACADPKGAEHRGRRKDLHPSLPDARGDPSHVDHTPGKFIEVQRHTVHTVHKDTHGK